MTRSTPDRPMIVSASYKTDIPAFYGDWFLRRLAAGACRVANPWGGPTFTVALTPEAVAGIVFWTRNMGPLRPHLHAIRKHYPFVVQYTVTGYPRALEASVIPAARAVAQIWELSDAFGSRAVVWRYDPILISEAQTPAWHRRNFAELAKALDGAVDEVVVSFTHFYRKTRRNLAAASQRSSYRDPGEDEKRALIAALSATAAGRGMRLTLCTQPGLDDGGERAARCIDAQRLSDVAGRAIIARSRGNRPGCACAESRDIGAYESCPHGCAYCYAVDSRSAAKRNHARHDPGTAMLIPPRTTPPVPASVPRRRVRP